MNDLMCLYKIVKDLHMTINQVAVLTIGYSSFEDGERGAWIEVCDETMSGFYPAGIKRFIVGFPDILGVDFKGLMIFPDGTIKPCYETWDGWQEENLNLENSFIQKPIKSKKEILKYYNF